MSAFRIRIREENGAAMVEFALVLPALLFIVLGIVDFGRVMNYWNDTNQIAGESARFAAVGKNPGADLPTPLSFREWVRGQAETGELREATLDGSVDSCEDRDAVYNCSKSVVSPLQVFVCAPAPTVGSPLTIVVRSNFNLIPFLNTQPDQPGTTQDPDKFGTIMIKGRATMRLEREYDVDVLGPLDPVEDCE